MKKIIAKTFTPSYDPVEDRIRLAINYEDAQNRVDFMITRSFILNLIPSFQEFILKNYPDSNYEPLTQTNDNASTDKQDEAISPTDNANFELYLNDEELLREVNLSFDANTQLTTLSFTSKSIVAQASLTLTIFEQIINIVKSAIPSINWGISHHF